jgi:predicted nucleic acid-binding Zn ribbon protein
MSPLYSYACSCGYEEDIHAASMSFGEILREHPPLCQRCGKVMERRPGRVGIRFKGKGWSSPSARAEDNS